MVPQLKVKWTLHSIDFLLFQGDAYEGHVTSKKEDGEGQGRKAGGMVASKHSAHSFEEHAEDELGN